MDPSANNELIAVQARIRREAEQQQEVLGDLRSWMGSIAKKDSAIRSGAFVRKPVASTSTVVATAVSSASANDRSEAKSSAATKAPSPVQRTTDDNKPRTADAHTYDKGYSKWDKFDVDAALAEAEKELGEGSPSTAQTQPAQPASTSSVAIPVRARKAAVQVKAGDSGLGSAEAEAAKAAGNAAYKAGDYSSASQAYTRAIAAAPTGSSAACVLLSNRAQCALQLKDYTAALEDASAALRADPTHVKSWLRRAAARSALGQPGAACRDLEVATALDRGNREAIVELRKAREASKACKKRALAEGAISLPIEVVEVVDNDDDDDEVNIESKGGSGDDDVATAILKTMRSTNNAAAGGGELAAMLPRAAPLTVSVLVVHQPKPSNAVAVNVAKAASSAPAVKRAAAVVIEEPEEAPSEPKNVSSGKTTVAIVEDDEDEEEKKKTDKAVPAAQPPKQKPIVEEVVAAPSPGSSPTKKPSAAVAPAVATSPSNGTASSSSSTAIPSVLAAPARTSFEFERAWRALSKPSNVALQDASRAYFLLYTMTMMTISTSGAAGAGRPPSPTALVDRLATCSSVGRWWQECSGECSWPRSLFKSYLEADVMMDVISILSAALIKADHPAAMLGALPFFSVGEEDRGKLKLEVSLRALLVLQGLALVPRLPSVTVAMLSRKDTEDISAVLKAAVEPLSDEMAAGMATGGFFPPTASAGDADKGSKEALVAVGLKALGIA